MKINTLISKISISLIISTAIILAVFSFFQNYLNPFDLYFSLFVFIYVIIFGVLFNSIFVATIINLFLLWALLINTLVIHFNEFIFWKTSFLESSFQTLFFNIGIGLLASLIVLIFLKLKQFRVTLFEKQIEKLSHNKTLLLFNLILIALLLLTPLYFLNNHSITLFDFASNFSKRQISPKTEKILATTPEQVLEFYFSSLESGNYENAYYAQSSDVTVDEQSYYNFIDKAKEEDIQLSKPIRHTVEKAQSSTNGANEFNYNVTISREDESSQEYKITLANGNNRWYIKEIILVRMD